MYWKQLTGILAILLLSACGSQIDENMSREVQDISAVTQNGEKVNLPEDLLGKYWIADFIFTSCETVCPPMTGNMARLQQSLQKADINVPLRSFSVDPENDTKSKLKSFAKPYQPDFSQWSFLTGYTFQEVKELSIKSFQSPLEKFDNSSQVAHGTSFFLINPEGKVIKRYGGMKAESVNKIIKDLKTLLK